MLILCYEIMMNHVLNVLIACEESQAECMAFRNLGHNAFSCDIQPCRVKGHDEWHIWADATPYLNGCTEFRTMNGEYHTIAQWDLIIAHPPCTYLTKCGSMHLYKDPDTWITDRGCRKYVNGERYMNMKKAAVFFRVCLNAKAGYVAVENPIPMAMAGLPKPSFFACPSWYGVKYTKKTLYWVKGLPPLMAEKDFPCPRCFTTASRGKYRSRTFPQMAKALAEQWSEFILNDYEHGK